MAGFYDASAVGGEGRLDYYHVCLFPLMQRWTSISREDIVKYLKLGKSRSTWITLAWMEFRVNNKSRMACLKVYFWPREYAPQFDDINETYDDVRFVRMTQPTQELYTALEGAFNAGTFGNDVDQKLSFVLDNEQLSNIDGGQYEEFRWPGHMIRFRIKPDFPESPEYKTLVNTKSKLYPQWTVPFEHIFSRRFNEPFILQGNYNAEIFLPISTTIIDEVHISENGNIKIIVQQGDKSLSDVMLKTYARVANEDQHHTWAPVSKKNKWKLDEKPTELMVALLDAKSEGIIDSRHWLHSWTNHDWERQGIMVTEPIPDIKRMLQDGENELVEYKTSASKENSLSIAQTISAFNNTLGGTILIGVNDDATINTGLNVKKAEEQIQQAIKEYCDPRPVIAVEKKQHGEHSILLIKVPKSYELCLIRGTPYIRKGSTDMAMRSDELKRWTKDSQSESWNRPTQRFS